MAQDCVIAVYPTTVAANEAVEKLQIGGFPMEHVSVVAKGDKTPEIEKDMAMGDDALQKAAVGAGLGTVGGALVGLAVATAGATSIVFAGPLGIGLAGAVTGAFLGGLSGWGVHTERIAYYENLIQEGNTLVVADGNPLEVVEANRILEKTEPSEIHIGAITESESPEVNPHEELPT